MIAPCICAIAGCTRPVATKKSLYCGRPHADLARKLKSDDRVAAKLAERPAERVVCIICKERPVAYSTHARPKLHCGRRECYEAVLRGEHLPARRAMRALPMGETLVEIDFGGGFAAHNVRTRDGGVFRPPRVAETRSLTGCSAALPVRGGEM